MNASAGLRQLVDDQAGIVSVAQLRRVGVSADAIAAALAGHRWQRIHRGTYATFTGTPPPMSRVWAALLACGEGAALSHRTAAWLHGLLPTLAESIDVSVPSQRRVAAPEGIRIHRSRCLEERVRRSRLPPRTRLVETVADLIDCAHDRDAVAATLSVALSGRFCRPDDLRRAIEVRPTMRHRAVALDLVGDVSGGAHSPLEVRYLRSVERAHRLPTAIRQSPQKGIRIDVHCRAHHVRVELDGRRYHSASSERFRDLRRDNVGVVLGEAILRYGWQDVTSRPCDVAAQVAAALRARGWTGAPRPCHRKCGVFAVLEHC